MTATRRLRTPSIVVATALALTGCTLKVPAIASASLTRHVAGAPAQRAELTPPQRRLLGIWLASHPTGWSRSYTSYAPTLEIRLTHPDGQTTVLNVIQAKVIAYGAFGQYEQRFAPAEISALLSQIGAGPG